MIIRKKDDAELFGEAYFALWDKKDFEALNKIALMTRITDNDTFIVRLDDHLKREYNDQTRFNDIPEPLESDFNRNKILNGGMTEYNKILAGKSTNFFSYVASGIGSTTPTVGQIKLDHENARMDTSLFGWLTPNGNLLRTGANFPPGIPDANVTEFGGCNSAIEPTTFAWRVTTSTALGHVQNDNFYTVSHTQYMTAKTEE